MFALLLIFVLHDFNLSVFLIFKIVIVLDLKILITCNANAMLFQIQLVLLLYIISVSICQLYVIVLRYGNLIYCIILWTIQFFLLIGSIIVKVAY